MKTIIFFWGLFQAFTLFGHTINDIDNLISSERYDDAYNSLLELKKSDPSNPYLYFSLGETVIKSHLSDPYSESKQNVIKNAKAYFAEGVKMDSLNPLNYVGYGILELFKNNDSIKADMYFSKAKILIPKKKKKINELHFYSLTKLLTSELYSATPRYYKARQYFSSVVEIKPKSATIYIGYGDIFMSESNTSEAIAQYKKALYIENTALTNVLVARIYFLARNYEESIKYYKMAINIDSLFAPAYKGLGDVYYRTNKNQLAKENYARFLTLTGNNIPAKINYVKALFKIRDFEETIRIAEDILKVDSSKLYIYRLAAYSYVDRQNPDMEKALFYIQKLFQKMPEDNLIVKDYTYYSKVLLTLKRDKNDLKLGGEMLEKAYLVDTTNQAMVVDLIKTAYKYKLYELEIKYLSKKINEGDNTVGNYFLLGKAYYYDKKFPDAHEVFKKIMALDSLNVEVYQWDAYTLISLDPELKEGLAKPSFEKLIQVTEGRAPAYQKERYEAFSYLGSYYLFTGNLDYEKAIIYFKKCIESGSENEQMKLKGYYSLAFAYYKSKQWENAKAAYETVLQLKPEDPGAIKALKDINKFLSANK